MTLNIKDIIMKKAKNKELTEAEVDYVIQSYAQSEISDAQMSALITGIYINDLTDAEISYFLKAVLADEKIVDLKEIDPGLNGNKGSSVLLRVPSGKTLIEYLFSQLVFETSRIIFTLWRKFWRSIRNIGVILMNGLKIKILLIDSLAM